MITIICLVRFISEYLSQEPYTKGRRYTSEAQS